MFTVLLEVYLDDICVGQVDLLGFFDFLGFFSFLMELFPFETSGTGICLKEHYCHCHHNHYFFVLEPLPKRAHQPVFQGE